MKILRAKIILVLTFMLFVSAANIARSQTADELRQNIDSHNEKIKQLDEEIKSYTKQIEAVGNEAKTLQDAVKVLDVSQNKIKAEIRKTETNISKTNLTLKELGEEIGKIESRIGSNIGAISKTLNSMRMKDDKSLIGSFLESKSLAEVLDEYETMREFQEKVREKTQELDIYKAELLGRKTAVETEKKKLVHLSEDLKDQNQILANNKKEKTSLLNTTKNKEAEYKRILAERQAERERFEKELFEYESQLKRIIDPNSYPSGKKGILSWPLDNVFITQPFGRTVDSVRLYLSGTHNGVDFRASRGTPIKASLGGVVEGTGNTDDQPGCYSYGKWILIKHDNGLSSLYSHLDLIKISKGAEVQEGEIIGYSGQTGYATGPHLHFTLFASQGVVIQKYSSSRNCKNVIIPIADVRAYLDPMPYFPSL